MIRIKQYGGKEAKPLYQCAAFQICPRLWKCIKYNCAPPLCVFSEVMARTRGWDKRGFFLPETKETKARDCTPGGGKGSVSELLSSPRTVEKLTFAYLDKFFEKHPSLLAELKSRVDKEVRRIKINFLKEVCNNLNMTLKTCPCPGSECTHGKGICGSW